MYFELHNVNVLRSASLPLPLSSVGLNSAVDQTGGLTPAEHCMWNLLPTEY